VTKVTEEKLSGESYYTGYRWIILILLGFSQVAANGSNIQLAALGGNLIAAYGLSTSAFGAITNTSFLGGVILGIPSGALADRFGAKKVLSVLMILGALGSVFRVYSTTAVTLFISMFLLGFIMAGTSANAAKLIAMWFPAKQMSFAMGVYIATSTLGAVIALMTTPALWASGKTIPQIFMYGTIACVACAVLWVIFGRSKPKGAPEIKSETVMEYMGTVLKNKDMWIASIVMFLLMGCVMASSTFLVVCLTMAKGVDMSGAAFWSSLSAILFLIGVMVVPVILGKIGYLKRGYIVIAIIAAVSIAVSWRMPYSTGSMVLLMVGFTFIGCGIPIHKQYPALLKSIPKEAVGSAGGMHATLQNIGAFLIPSYILGSIAGDNYNLIMYGVSALMLISVLLCLALPEIGSKGNQQK